MATKATRTDPDRMRAHQLAKELGITSKTLIARLAADGIDVKSPQSSVPAEIVERLRREAADTPADTTADNAVKGARGAPAMLFVSPPEPTPRTARAGGRRRAGRGRAGRRCARRRLRKPPAPAARRPSAAARGRGRPVVAAAESAAEALADESDRNRPDHAPRHRPRSRSSRPKRRRPPPLRPSTADAPHDAAEVQPKPDTPTDAAGEADADTSEDTPGDGGSSRRRRRRRRSTAGGTGPELGEDDPENTVVHVRAPRAKTEDDGVRGVKGSTRLEAKRQRRRDGRESGRRRPPILTEAEFLARRESVDRVMAVRQHGSRTQIAVLEDDVLVEHYVTQASSNSYVGNIYLGRVQNVLPSMEAAFVDIGKGRNGVLYAGEVNWDAAGLEGKSRAIEGALKSGDSVLVQVTKDPIGHKGARLTSQISLPGRYLVYVPRGAMTGISRKLPDTERHRLKAILKKVVPEDAGVIIRTAAEGASEEDITRDVERLTKLWDTIEKTTAKAKAAPILVHAEADLAVRVVRDVFNEDFTKLVVQGDGAWKTIWDYVDSVAPELAPRLSKHVGTGDLFHDLRIDEQLMKALDRKVWLPSGGSLVIDRTEAMTVIDVNTGKFVGSGGNLEETVTRNNLEAAEEIVRQLRLRDVGGIIVIDFIDMVLESNRELVLRRLTECLGRDRTKHQVAEVTSLGLVQMTRKRVGEGLLEAFSEPCTVCHGRGVILHTEPVERAGAASGDEQEEKAPGKRRGSARKAERELAEPPITEEQRQARLAAINAIHRAAHGDESEAIALEAAGLEAAELEAPEGGATEPEPAAELEAPELATTEPESGAERVDDAAAELELTAVASALDALPADTEQADADPAVAEPVDPARVDAEPVEAETNRPEVLTPRAAPPRRRRRAATRPAGPPVAAQG